MMKITVDEKWCKGCKICISSCPKEVLKLSGKRNEKGHLVAFAAYPEKCIGCRMCEKFCPDLCITVEQEDKDA